MRDQVGLVARLAGFFADRGLNIVDASNHTDPSAERDARFFARWTSVAGFTSSRSVGVGANTFTGPAACSASAAMSSLVA